jgi:hypothetical protein
MRRKSSSARARPGRGAIQSKYVAFRLGLCAVVRQAGERLGVIVSAAAVVDVAAIEAKNTEARPPLVEAASYIRTVLIQRAAL